MRKTIISVLSALLLQLASHAAVVNVDFDKNAGATFSGQGGHVDSGNDYWNSSRNSLSDLTASDGVTATTIDLAISTGARFDTIGANIPAGQSHSELVGDYAYAHHSDITVDITGLDPYDPYRLYIYCQGDQLSQKATVTFPGNSPVSTTGLIDGTISEGANYVVLDVTADGNGSISGTVARNGSSYVALNGIQIVELSQPRVFVHPGMGVTLADLDHVKTNLTVEPWKKGYDAMAASSHASLGYTMKGPFGEVGHTAAENRNDWRDDMRAVHHLARMWYFTDDGAYAQKARDILISWANTHTNFLPGETYLDMGYHAHDVFEGAEILRGTWPGWTQSDTDTLKTYFENVWWNSGHLDLPGPLRSANQGMAQFVAALGVAVFNDDEAKFEQCLEVFRTDTPAALLSSLPNGQIGDTGRDSHAQGQLMLMAWAAEVFWTQGVDVFSEYDDRLLAAAEYISRYNLDLMDETPFVQAGTVYDIYPEIHTFDGPYANWDFESKMITILHSAFVVRNGMRAPYLEKYLSYAPQKESSFCYLSTVDASTATNYPPVIAPASVASVTSLSSVDMGDATGGSASYSGGTWTVNGRGSGLWYSSEPDYHFAYLPVTGDATIIAQITSFSGGGDLNARAGLVFTESLSNGDRMGTVAFTAPDANDDLDCFYRGYTASSHRADIHGKPNQTRPRIPYWLKIERIGDRVHFYSSPDGVSWSCAGSADYDLADTAYFGLAVSADNNNNLATATFANVRITGGDGGEASQVPAAPFAIYASPGRDVVPLRWLESFEADGYKIWRSTQPGGPYTMITLETGTSYLDTTVNPGTHYYYAVSAVNALGESPLSPEEKFWLPDTSWFEAEDYDAQSGIQTEDTKDYFGGRNVGWIGDGDWCRYNGITINAGAVFRARIAGMQPQVGDIEVRSGSTTGTLLGTVSAIHTGGAQNWATVETTLSGPTGVHDLFLVFTKGAAPSPAFNLNWFDIVYPQITDFDLGQDLTLAYDPATNALVNLGGITAWDSTTPHLKLADGSDLSNVDFTALGIASWKTADFSDNNIVTTWDGADLSGLTLINAAHNFGAGDSFVGANFSGATFDNGNYNQFFLFADLTDANFSGATLNVPTWGGANNAFRDAVLTRADFSGVVWGTPTSTADAARFFSGGSGATSAATKDDAVTFAGADLSLITGDARTDMINNLGGFDGGTPIGAKFDPAFIVNSGWDTATLVAAGWQYSATDAFATIEGEDYDDQSGVSTQPCSEGGLNVQAIQNGDWCAYFTVDFAGGADEFQARVASATAGGNIEIRLGSPTGTLVGTCVVNGTGGWQSWTTVTAGVSGVSGVQDLYLVFTGGGGYLFNVNWFTFVSTGPDTTPPSAPTGLVATAGDNSVSLDWNNNLEPDLASYTVYRSTTSGSGYTALATGLTNSDHVDATAVNGTTYYYVVTALDNAANESAFSNEDSAMPTEPNQPPAFTADPVNKPAATEDLAYSDTLAGSATDPNAGDTLTYSKLSGPAWLSVAGSGALSGTPSNDDVGANVFTVRVTDSGGLFDDATLNITVNNVNDPPAFTSDPFSTGNATEVVAYSDTIAGSATDPDAGDTLSYSKVSGPAWLSVSANGALSGTPGVGDAGVNAFTVQVDDGNGGSDTATLNITVLAGTPDIRVTEYYLTTGDFTGTTATITLNQDLANDYYILVRGSRTGDGSSNPNNDYARVLSVPGGRGDLASSGANNQIQLQRQAADFDWEGVVTVVECQNSASAGGFKLVDAVVTSMTTTSGTSASASWTDINQVVLFGGYRGGGVEMFGNPSNRKEGTGCYTRLYPSGSGTINWSRDAGGETMHDATMTTFVVEWGSEWTIQHVNVAGNNGGGGADATGEYTTAAINSVVRANTWVWGTGTRIDSGIGDCAEACLITLGDGVNQNANESLVAVGSEYTDAYDFDVYVMTHSGLQVDHRFKLDGDSTGLDVAVPVNTAPAGTRFGWVYNGCHGTGTAFPRPRLWSRYTSDTTVTISRGYDGQPFPAWVQGIDFSNLNQ